MDKTAIEKIEQTALAAAGTLQQAAPDGTLALPDNYKLHSTEQHQRGRFRFRGQMFTDSIGDFVAYVKRNATADAQGFIDASNGNLGATVMLNLGDANNPGHADWRAHLNMRVTPAFAAMLAASGEAMSQREVIDFIEDWAHVFGAEKEGENGEVERIPVARAVAAIRKVKIEAKSASETTAGNFQQQRSTLDSVEASSDAGLPDLLTFATEPYFGMASRVFKMRLSVMTGGREPALRFRVIGLEQHQEDIAQEFKSDLLVRIGDATPMTIGIFKP